MASISALAYLKWLTESLFGSHSFPWDSARIVHLPVVREVIYHCSGKNCSESIPSQAQFRYFVAPFCIMFIPLVEREAITATIFKVRILRLESSNGPLLYAAIILSFNAKKTLQKVGLDPDIAMMCRAQAIKNNVTRQLSELVLTSLVQNKQRINPIIAKK